MRLSRAHGQRLVALAAVSAATALIGCQVHVGGQTLPSPRYLQDDVQYFPPGPEFKLSREAAAIQAALEEERLRKAGRFGPPGVPAP